MARVTTAVVVLGLCCFLGGGLQAQSTNASVTGYVTDPSKAVIVDAKVIAINVGTNVRYEATTNKTGSYSVVNLPPGNYRVEVEKAGFKTVVKSDIVLHVQDAIAINFDMAIGSTSEVVTVEGGAPLVNTQDASVSTVVNREFVENLPLNGRSFQIVVAFGTACRPWCRTRGPSLATTCQARQPFSRQAAASTRSSIGARPTTMCVMPWVRPSRMSSVLEADRR